MPCVNVDRVTLTLASGARVLRFKRDDVNNESTVR